MDAIILAAGNSVRFGENKLLHLLNGKPVYRYMLELLYQKQKEGMLEQIVIVSQYDEIFQEIKTQFPGIRMVRNPAPEKGISGSIRLGLSDLLQKPAQSGACLFTVADQPGFTEASLEKMLRFWQEHAFGIVAACHTARPDEAAKIKNPVIFSSRYYQELLGLTGDAGGKQVVRRHMEDTGLCEIPAFETEDLDTKEKLFAFEKKMAKKEKTMDARSDNHMGLKQILAETFPFLAEKGHVISIVGAGGKTTLMETLAAYYAESGHSVIITTTTHIMRPESYPVAQNREQLHDLLARHRIVAAGMDAPGGKLQMSDQMSVADYRAAADAVLIEADGAKRLPCKAPKETEPVIPEESDIVIGVVGMDALGRPLSECCFRKEQAMELLGVDAGRLMTEKDLADILHSKRGTRKDVGHRDYYIVLNKCDNAHLRKQGMRIQEMLEQAGERHVVCISLKSPAGRQTE